MMYVWVYLLWALAAWFFIWPRLLDFVVDYREPDRIDYGFSGYISLMLALLWPVAGVGYLLAKGMSWLGKRLYGKKEYR